MPPQHGDDDDHDHDGGGGREREAEAEKMTLVRVDTRSVIRALNHHRGRMCISSSDVPGMKITWTDTGR